MKANKSQITKEIILEKTLQLVDENEGIKNVTLRDIAKNVGCTHTNLYNYFGSLSEIFWEALGQVLIKMINYSRDNLTFKDDPEKDYYVILSNFIDFSLDHIGLYKLLRMESIDGEPPSEVMNIVTSARKEFDKNILEAARGKLSEERASFVSDVFFAYLHGEISLWINKRRLRVSKEDTKAKILSNLKQLFQELVIRK
ncbi:TetR/AcrR family transcriptional regulator [Clostridium sp. AWRP]|uniref:TetR/AcrR family transcriptional regulator n=1 Tax=Clostridium sp. AWRP TaxID=2212991 RepID=UPI0015869640|nr:TetR/AcrR family transcriptional regulator [Clostridium sp. AWRP]